MKSSLNQNLSREPGADPYLPEDGELLDCGSEHFSQRHLNPALTHFRTHGVPARDTRPSNHSPRRTTARIRPTSVALENIYQHQQPSAENAFPVHGAATSNSLSPSRLLSQTHFHSNSLPQSQPQPDLPSHPRANPSDIQHRQQGFQPPPSTGPCVLALPAASNPLSEISPQTVTRAPRTPQTSPVVHKPVALPQESSPESDPMSPIGRPRSSSARRTKGSSVHPTFLLHQPDILPPVFCDSDGDGEHNVFDPFDSNPPSSPGLSQMTTSKQQHQQQKQSGELPVKLVSNILSVHTVHNPNETLPEINVTTADDAAVAPPLKPVVAPENVQVELQEQEKQEQLPNRSHSQEDDVHLDLEIDNPPTALPAPDWEDEPDILKLASAERKDINSSSPTETEPATPADHSLEQLEHVHPPAHPSPDHTEPDESTAKKSGMAVGNFPDQPPKPKISPVRNGKRKKRHSITTPPKSADRNANEAGEGNGNTPALDASPEPMQLSDSENRKENPKTRSEADVLNARGEAYLLGTSGKQDFEEAVALFRKAASEGCMPAVYNLGNCLEQGRGTGRDIHGAQSLFRHAADEGHVPSMVKMGSMLEGEGDDEAVVSREELEAAYQWYLMAAEQNDPLALFKVASAHHTGHGAPQNVPKATLHYEKAIRAGHVEAAFQLGKIYESGIGVTPDSAKAISHYALAAKKGNSDAQLRLAQCYHRGYMVEKNLGQAVPYYIMAANAGVLEAQFEAGKALELGEGISKNLDKAKHFYEKAKQKGHSESSLRLAALYETGDVVPKDTEKSQSLLEEAAEKGSVKAALKLGKMFEDRRGIRNINHAMSYYKQAADAGSPDGMFALAVIYEHGKSGKKKMVQAYKLYDRASKLGHAGAQASLGQCYLTGCGVARNVPLAVKHFKSSAEKGNRLGQFELGDCYMDGTGVKRDETRACHWFRLAAEQSHAEAQVRYAECLLNGTGTTKDVTKALSFADKAICQGCAEGYRFKGDFYADGVDCETDLKAAHDFFKKGADLGNTCSMVGLGKMYETGEGVKEDLRRAVALYTKAAKGGHCLALNNLGLLYERGIHVKQNITEAIRLYNQAIEKGSNEAMVNLGDCYMTGNGVVKDIERAVELYREAADNGSFDAQCELGACYYQGKGVKQDVDLAIELWEAAKDKESEAVRHLGEAHFDGLGVRQDFNMAFSLFKQASEAGNADAKIDLGKCYYTGRGVERNYKEAAKMFQAAIDENANKVAKQWLGNMYFEGIGVARDYAKGFKLLVESTNSR